MLVREAAERGCFSHRSKGERESQGLGCLGARWSRATGCACAYPAILRAALRSGAIRGRAPPEGALDLRVCGALSEGRAVGTREGDRCLPVCVGAKGKRGESPRSQKARSSRVSNQLAPSNRGRGHRKVTPVIPNSHNTHHVPGTVIQSSLPPASQMLLLSPLYSRRNLSLPAPEVPHLAGAKPGI